ncbi:hypothetical protein ZWY2020_043664 [Hordeum vulgare]|nr:hypothetical protein ZWY2020_043664 [Hordeum vulgare]
MVPPRPPPRRPLTPVDNRIASIQNRCVVGVQNSGRDLASGLRAPSPICCRPPRGPAMRYRPFLLRRRFRTSWSWARRRRRPRSHHFEGPH